MAVSEADARPRMPQPLRSPTSRAPARSRGHRLQPASSCRARRWHRRRIRLRQVDRGARHHALLGKNGSIVGGEILFEGRDMRTMSPGGAARHPRLQDRHGLPGADGVAQPGDEGRPSSSWKCRLSTTGVSQEEAYKRAREMLARGARCPIPSG